MVLNIFFPITLQINDKFPFGSLEMIINDGMLGMFVADAPSRPIMKEGEKKNKITKRFSLKMNFGIDVQCHGVIN